MKNILFNLSASAVAFYIPFQIALLTDIGLVKNAVLIAFVIQWVLFIPAYIMQTEKFYDLSGSLTYISIISYVFYKSSEFNLGNLILSVFIIIWAVRLGSFLFLGFKKQVRIRDLEILSLRQQGFS